MEPLRLRTGVVWLGFEDLMPSQQRLTITKRAVWPVRVPLWKLNDLKSSGWPPPVVVGLLTSSRP